MASLRVGHTTFLTSRQESRPKATNSLPDSEVAKHHDGGGQTDQQRAPLRDLRPGLRQQVEARHDAAITSATAAPSLALSAPVLTVST